MDEKPIERVRQIIAYSKLSVAAFEKATGMSNNAIQSALKRNTNLKGATLNNILKAFPEISAEWLLTGYGKMMKIQVHVEEPDGEDHYILEGHYVIELQRELIIKLKEEIASLREEIASLKNEKS